MGKFKSQRRGPRRPPKAAKSEKDDGGQKEQAVVMDAVVAQDVPNLCESLPMSIANGSAKTFKR